MNKRLGNSLVASAVAVFAATACHEADPERGVEQTALPAGVAARVGKDDIELGTVVDIATANGISLPTARGRAIFDALLASHARERFGLLAIHRAESSARARTLLESFVTDAHRAGPSTDDEINAATSARWWELDRPPMRRTTHAVVTLAKPEQENSARALADRIAAAVTSAESAQSFRALATPITAPDLKVKIEDLDPVAGDGRTFNPGAPPPPGSESGHYSAAYVAGAFAIPALHRTSPVVRSEFGFHVIFLSELLPEHRVPLSERRRILEPEVFVHRAAKLEAEALAHARSVDPVQVERSALDLSEKVNVQQ
jgi:hypothetical protein